MTAPQEQALTGKHLIAIKIAATDLMDHAHVAYWMDGVNESYRDYHIKNVREKYAKLKAIFEPETTELTDREQVK